ncbi:hypothetical protein F5Y10DRAFT_262958 [Nemania abortiva]|nr:hypothetical protein F5Y10DRAFT_262958 [Nemania abortiva]
MNRIKGAWRAANTHLLSTDDSLFGTLTHIVREASEVAIETNLSLLHFIKHNFSEQRIELSTLITITGTAFYAYATTCLEYLKEIWPNSGETLLPILQKAIREILDRPDSEARVDTEHDLFYRISVELYQDGTLKLRTKGPEAFVVDIIQQLCWLNSTFSMLPPGQDGTGYCTPVIDPICGSDQDVPIIRLGTSFTKLLTDEKRSCWLSLFSNVVIAHGFPIPKREIGIGLEMSLELMAAIIGARHAAIFDGGVVVKGFSSMFLPVKKACGEIQWHYVANYDPDMWLSYDEGVKRCSNRSLLRDINLDSLKTARCFIGWNSLVEIRIGDESNNFNDVEFSDAKEVKSVLQIPSASVGFQQFALAQVNVTFGKRDGKCHFQRSSSYRRIISASESMFIVLFDTAERRSYLVAASGLLLHILRHRISLGLGGIPASKIRIPSAVNITKTLLQNAKLQVSPEEDESLLVGNVVSEIWSVLELLQAQIIHSEKNTNLEIHATWQERLLGYEYMSVVRDWSPMPLKELEVHKSCGGWPRLARDINALVLLGSGFGDLIRPIDDQEILCHQWKSLPRDRDYMAIPVKVLLALYSSAGCRQTKKRLTSTDLQLHSEGVSFQACPTPKEWQCSCDRLQQVISNSSFGHICVPELIEGSGAVIIGESKSLLKRFAISTLKFTGIPSLTHNTLDSEITANLNSDTPGSSCLFESSGFRHTNVTSPVCSADDGGSSKKIDSMKAGIRNFCDRRKRSQSEMAGSSATLSPTWETRPPKLAKQSCIAVLPSDSHP